MRILTPLMAITLTLTSFTSPAQSTKTEKEEVQDRVESFFAWYLGVINKGLLEEFRPQFRADSNGRVTLEMDLYIANLRKYYFSEALIKIEINSYQTCIDNLSNIKYTDFKQEWTDLDQFEEAGCDFGNYYRWTEGQEPIAAIHVSEVKQMGEGVYQVEIVYDEYSSAKDEHHFWGKNTITVTKESGDWCIGDINWR